MALNAPILSPSRIADHFCNYLFHGYPGNDRHVQRVSAWLGFLISGLAKLNVQWRTSQKRQLIFEHKGKRYKARYNHRIKPRGGVEFVEVAKSQGSPDIGTVVTITSLSDAEAFYNQPHL
jgi:hypothetical protein